MLISKITACFILLLTGTASSIYAKTEAVPNFNEHIAHANEFAREKLYERALAEVNKAIEQNPQAARAYKVRGNVYFAMGDYSKALSDFDQLITLAPSNADSYVCHSIVNSALENYEQAIDDINRALNIAPKSKAVKEARDKILRRISNAKSTAVE